MSFIILSIPVALQYLFEDQWSKYSMFALQ